MEHLTLLLNIVLHLDIHLAQLMQQYGAWAYGLLCLIIFCETGLVFTPFLPGDSLLFTVGALAAKNIIHFKLIFALLFCAALLGDQTNYWIGRSIGHLLLKVKTDHWYFKRSYIEKTHAFYARYGGKTLIIARFIPIIRTFAPFVAGLSKMTYLRFTSFSLVANFLWIFLLTFAGFWFGNIPIIRENFTLVILAIIFISILPGIITFWQHRPSRQN